VVSDRNAVIYACGGRVLALAALAASRDDLAEMEDRRAIDRFELGQEAGIAAYVASLAPAPDRRGLRRLLRR
jgi:hypothetical protein